jgi:HK97 family phage prohead protease
MTVTLEYRNVGLAEFRMDEELGTFEGLALPWETIDSYRTRFRMGAFVEGGLDDGLYPLLFLHDTARVLGTFRARETSDGLLIAGRYDDTQEGRDGRVRAFSGSAPELSVGFNRTAVDPDDPDYITGAKLFEVSQITARHAAVPGATLTSVRTGHGVLGDDAQSDVEALTLTRAGAAVARLRLSNLGG